MESMNLFAESSDLSNLHELYSYINAGRIIEYSKIKWLAQYLTDLLNYEQLYGNQPKEKLNELYEVFKDLFPYNDTVYRGIKLEDNVDDKLRILREDELYSWTYNLDIAYDFATPHSALDFETSIVIANYETEGFSLCAFMTYIYNSFKGIIDTFEFLNDYLHECEVLAYYYSGAAEVYDIKELTLRDIKDKHQPDTLKFDKCKLKEVLYRVKLKENLTDLEKSLLWECIYMLERYHTHGYVRPNDLTEMFYSEFKNEFEYKGIAYHAIRDINVKNIDNSYKGFVSFTKDKRYAEQLSLRDNTDCLIAKPSVISKEITAFDFHKFMLYVEEFYDDFIEDCFIDEQEVIIKID